MSLLPDPQAMRPAPTPGRLTLVGAGPPIALYAVLDAGVTISIPFDQIPGCNGESRPDGPLNLGMIREPMLLA